jgi:hypothetical protein
MPSVRLSRRLTQFGNVRCPTSGVLLGGDMLRNRPTEFNADASGAPPLNLRFPLERIGRNNQREPVEYTHCRFNREQRAGVWNIFHNAINSRS